MIECVRDMPLDQAHRLHIQMGLLPDMLSCGLRMRRERFPRHQLLRKPLVSNPGMHDGACVTQVPWRMSGSLTRGDRESVPGVCMCNPQFYVSGERPMVTKSSILVFTLCVHVITYWQLTDLFLFSAPEDLSTLQSRVADLERENSVLRRENEELKINDREI